ncbi:SURF1 family protein [Arenicella sp. 4NH20-0111]|uniref:SURF1 family protein n=1 Tax=Arenicella sp. 4NH20-0111 TaxID=3127648 RepID=UPI003340E2BB
MPSQKSPKRAFILPILLIAAVLMILCMLRLGVWQLDRAEEKQVLLTQVQKRSQSMPAELAGLEPHLLTTDGKTDLRFSPIKAIGEYISEQSILIDNQVVGHQGGYQLVTPFRVAGMKSLVLVSRGWLPSGATRQDLPEFETPEGRVTIQGRLNKPFAQPPLWKEGYPVNEGQVWQYLPIEQYASQIQASVLPLMIELAPESTGSEGLKVQWQSINDEWVAKHKAYAFQWFSMAVAFFIACLILLFRNFVRPA